METEKKKGTGSSVDWKSMGWFFAWVYMVLMVPIVIWVLWSLLANVVFGEMTAGQLKTKLEYEFAHPDQIPLIAKLKNFDDKLQQRLWDSTPPATKTQIEDIGANYEIKGKCSGPSVFYAEGKTVEEPCTDEVVYEVFPKEKKIIRRAVVSFGGGLETDGSEYTVISAGPDMVSRRGQVVSQRIIKAVGQVSIMGAYEMLVIGDDFIMTVKSASNYFTIYQYDRQ